MCINNAVEGTLYYRGNRYQAPCNPELMRYPEHVALFKQQIADVHTRLCAEDADVSIYSDISCASFHSRLQIANKLSSLFVR